MSEVIQEGSVEDRQDLLNLIEAQRLELADCHMRIDRLNEAYAEQVRVKDSTRREFEDFKERITVRMHAEADRRDWCSEFDDIMEEFGLRRRTREWCVTFDIDAFIQTRLIARDETHAKQLAWNALRVEAGEDYEVRGQTVSIRDISCEAYQDE